MSLAAAAAAAAKRDGRDEAAPCFVSPQRQENDLPRFALTGPPSVRLPPLCMPPPPSFISHLETKTDTTCGRGGTALPRLKFISRTQPRLSFSKHDLFGFTGQRCKVNLIPKMCLYHGTSPQMNSKYNEASVILCLKFSPYGLDLYLVCLYTLQKCHEILDLTYLRSQ